MQTIYLIQPEYGTDFDQQAFTHLDLAMKYVIDWANDIFKYETDSIESVQRQVELILALGISLEPGEAGCIYGSGSNNLLIWEINLHVK